MGHQTRGLGDDAVVDQAQLAERGGLTVAELRDRLGVSRKYSLALLEHFDSIHLTRREGEKHVPM